LSITVDELTIGRSMQSTGLPGTRSFSMSASSASPVNRGLASATAAPAPIASVAASAIVSA
jgi:hypothetical protein